MLRKWIVLLMVMLICVIFVIPQLAADCHFLLSRQQDLLTLNPLDGWAVVIAGGKPLQFYLLFTACAALFWIWFLISDTIDYRTRMQKVAPGIYTPRPAGQGQFGSARWMDAKALRSAFTPWKIRKKSPEIRALMQAGKEDRLEVKNATIPTD